MFFVIKMIRELKKKLKYFIKKILGIKGFPSYYTIGTHKKIDITSDKSMEHFSKLARKIIEEKKTYLYYDRLLTIYDAVKSMPLDSEVAEVGVKQGGSTKFIASLVSPECKIYSCDTFVGHIQIDDMEKHTHLQVGDHGNVKLTEVKNYLETFKNVTIIEGDILETYKKIPLENIGLVHLDVDVLIPTHFVLENFFPVVKKGCIFVLDDYLNKNTPGVKKAVDDFKLNKAYKGRFYFITLLTGQAIIVKIY
jgi:O-methyltransferase